MLAVMNGDISQASLLFKRYHTSVYSYLARINRDSQIAQDMTQNVFEKMIKYRNSYQQQKCFKAWLFTIARNVNIDHHRKKKYSITDEHVDMVDSAMGVHQRMEQQENNKKLHMAMDRLAPEEKELLVLTKFERMKYHQVSTMMGMSESALKVKAHRAMKKLRTILINELNYEY